MHKHHHDSSNKQNISFCLCQCSNSVVGWGVVGANGQPIEVGGANLPSYWSWNHASLWRSHSEQPYVGQLGNRAGRKGSVTNCKLDPPRARTNPSEERDINALCKIAPLETCQWRNKYQLTILRTARRKLAPFPTKDLRLRTCSIISV